jgi:cytochrome P450
MLGRLKFLHRDAKWYAACTKVTDFCAQRVEEAMQRLEKGEERRTEKDRLRLVDEAANLTADRYTLRSLVLSVFSPAHDGAAVALSNVFFHLARHPRVWSKLRAEVVKDAEKPITYDLLNSYTYLKNVFRESKSFTNGFSMGMLTAHRSSRNPYCQWQPAHLSQCKPFHLIIKRSQQPC